MIKYQVRIRVQKTVSARYKEWLLSHVNKIVNLKEFMKAYVFSEHESLEQQEEILCVDYYLEDLRAYEHYITKEAPRLRQEAEAFTGFFTIERQVMVLISKIEKT